MKPQPTANAMRRFNPTAVEEVLGAIAIATWGTVF